MRIANVREFFKTYPDDETCLAHLFDVRFGQGHTCPKCERSAKWYRLASEQAFSCQWCGHHIHPMVGTIFAKSRTPLQLWFYAIYLFTTTRHGVSAKELERQLGVTYKTAWRMGQMIRKHMAAIDGDDILGDDGETVEIDETWVGGTLRGQRGAYRKNKTVVMGMMERDGEIITKVVGDTKGATLLPVIRANVDKAASVETDTMHSYKALGSMGYKHATVNHSEGYYVSKSGVTVNSVENFWRHLKCSIKGTHNNVSAKYLERYAKEFEYRFNRRSTPHEMICELLTTFPEMSV